ncbi:MAG: hypothetical protein UR85_C0006G0023 [Candidatus Nomurabacteria bacterium GW2011_GWF2_35_66]|uniref:Uncharacterized protein n=1 Tax=Candidatus Nomurabacteria bacterium GW2011_GWE1_35_16 TaxID=1618761 RepID=A0A0G0EG51_9BACT|nr:MAG: hypothetical protein UR55_C0008G0004 [Candidatus Nomurabacteria bacterium GW2011_GWF1_34_20]KKP63152.1 MAG: hypothetical protein UR57_C0008G0023 [Candidatus Nomurabacteria bacterium GW2011_GWE2_34_25]KKP66322.1 MAG: hypothetical protein UR64_C0009G0025 [Candidatus Nomurabacteria bacterium GW2011_GWE1_35_16]KKP83238.1 MAG: hypothetical protein UR85_C0006G0023 [Candidatus Nomurabacteria bacterium GW2011_GWF2_35_66]HAE36312.1 hypothetical protein [Candidatus Nomurabacteria bacterium]
MESYENSGSYLEKLGEVGSKAKIEKLGIKPGKKSKTKVGKIIELDLYVPIRPGMPIRKTREIDNPNPLRQKRGIGITSPVVSILKINEDEYLIETITSTYRLWLN